MVWYGFSLIDHIQFSRLIKKIVANIRKTLTYDKWQRRTKFDVKICPVCGIDSQMVQFDTHHFPETLFEVVEKSFQKHIDLDDLDKINEFQIMKEVMDEHLNDQVNYIVLCKHCHEKFHSGVPDVVERVEIAYQEKMKNNIGG